MTTNLTKNQRRALQLLRKRVCFETAVLHFTDTQLAAMTKRQNSGPGDRTFCDDTAEIREATRIYRDSWVLPLIDALLADDPDKYCADLGVSPRAYLKIALSSHD